MVKLALSGDHDNLKSRGCFGGGVEVKSKGRHPPSIEADPNWSRETCGPFFMENLFQNRTPEGVKKARSGAGGGMRGRRTKREGGVSYLEIMIALSVLAVIIGIGVPSVGKSNREAQNKALMAEARTLNDAIYRVEAGGRREEWLTLSNILYIQKDKDEAVRWLVENGYVSQHD